MKVGVLQFFSWPERRIPLEEVYRRALERIVVMDRTGFDAVWLAEHHFTTYSVCPSVHLMALEAAHRTSNLRIGTAVSLAALYHPLRLAEEVAMVDVLTGGRVNWGAGRGFEPAEFAAFGVPGDETAPRFREAVEVVLAAWKNERLTFHGKYWDFDDVEVLPKPMQRPHPPTWVAATSPDALGWAASMGHQILMDPHATFAEIGAKYDGYVADLTANGFAVPTDTPMARLLAVAGTDDEAEQVARAGAAWTIGAYAHGAGATSMGHDPEGEVAERIEGYVRDRIIWGSPARVRDELARLAEVMRLRYLMIAPLSHESFVRFTDEVLPAL
jgi:alkanesulfonate monooxygenase SsuD/methylene tetrahydromethanopterin reductase-like flavin-dependent oxidoreductase (luciferase family)